MVSYASCLTKHMLGVGSGLPTTLPNRLEGPASLCGHPTWQAGAQGLLEEGRGLST